jgi:serine/threonine protein kinase
MTSTLISSGGTQERYCPTCEKSFVSMTRCPDDGTQLVVLAADDRLIGLNLDGRYTVVERIGQGGMGAVYRATQHSVGRDVALKVVRPDLFADPTVIKRFLREAKLASRLTHPNAVAVVDFGQTTDGLFYLVMELLDGDTLDKVLKQDGRLSPERAINIASQICDALDGAHELEIVHRDLKPGNVMLLPGAAGRDLVKVMDFGLAKSLSGDAGSQSVTRSGAMLGTPAFMPPELAVGREADARTDLYSLGCILYVMLSGRLPFVADTLHDLVNKHATETPPPLPATPPALAAVVMRLLAKDPDDRYATADQTHHALEIARRGRPASIETTLPSDAQPLAPVSDSSAGFEETAAQDETPGTPSSTAPTASSTAPTASSTAPTASSTAPTASSTAPTASSTTRVPAAAAAPTPHPEPSARVPAASPTPAHPERSAPKARGVEGRVLAAAVGAGVLVAGGVLAWRLTRDPAATAITLDAATPLVTSTDAAVATPPPPPPVDAAPAIDARVALPIDARASTTRRRRPDAAVKSTRVPPPTVIDARTATAKPDAAPRPPF